MEFGEQGLQSCSNGREPVSTLPASSRDETGIPPVWLDGGALRDVCPMFAECLSCV